MVPIALRKPQLVGRVRGKDGCKMDLLSWLLWWIIYANQYSRQGYHCDIQYGVCVSPTGEQVMITPYVKPVRRGRT
jgi:hypothetical protein